MYFKNKPNQTKRNLKSVPPIGHFDLFVIVFVMIFVV